MNKKSWLVVLIVVLVAFGIYSYSSGVGLGPALNKNVPGTSYGINERSCSNYDQLSRMTEEQIGSCLERHRDAVEKVAREVASDLGRGGFEDYEFRSGQDECIGDVNGNGVVNAGDVDAVMDDWGCLYSGDLCEGDVDNNGLVNVDDLLLVLANFGCEWGERYIIAGTASGYYGSISYLAKTYMNGEVEWSREDAVGGYWETLVRSMQLTPNGDYILAGKVVINEDGPSDMLLLKKNSEGYEEWVTTFGEDNGSEEALSVQATPDGGYILAGRADYSHYPNLVYLVKTNSHGDEEWSKFIEGGESYSVLVTPDGGYILTSHALNQPSELLLIKINSEGNEEWRSDAQPFENNYPKDIQVTPDGGYIIVGKGRNDIYDAFGGFLLKTDSDGDAEWSRTFLGEEGIWNYANSVKVTPDGGYIIAGLESSKEWASWLLKTDSNGNEEWKKIWEDDSVAKSVQLTSDGGYIIGGYGPGSALLLKTNSEGNEEWRGNLAWGSHGESVQVLTIY